MIYIVLNAWPIALATLAGLLFGAALYRAVLGNALRLSVGTGITVALAEFWFAAILAGALILAPAKGGVWTMTIGSAVVIWIGFVVPVIAATYRIRALPLRTTLTDCAHWLGVMLVQAVVLRLIGLVPPPT